MSDQEQSATDIRELEQIFVSVTGETVVTEQQDQERRKGVLDGEDVGTDHG
jgi:hypothetical protein